MKSLAALEQTASRVIAQRRPGVVATLLAAAGAGLVPRDALARHAQELVDLVIETLTRDGTTVTGAAIQRAAQTFGERGVLAMDVQLGLYRTLHRAVANVLREHGLLEPPIENHLVAVVQLASAGAGAAVRARLDRDELDEIAERLRVVADSVPIHLLLIDRDERFLFVNAAAAAMWQRTPESFIGLTLRDVLGDDVRDALRPYAERALAGEVVAYESPFRDPSGRLHVYLNTYSPHRGADGHVRGFIATGTDITERKRAEDMLSASVDELREERELRERFVAALTHDLRTPLTAARIGAEVIASPALEPARIPQLATRIIRNIDRADRMIRDVLDVSSLRRGVALPLAQLPCDLVAVTRRTLDELAIVHGPRFELHAPPEPVDGHWDPEALRRIVENLCTNAVKYGSREHPVTVSIDATPAQVRIDVHNLGAPIPEEQQRELFEAFRRAGGAATRSVLGWGIGLAIVRGLTEAHHGTVRVTSTQEQGTTFRVVLPRAQG